jgi:phosphoribosylformylglycinamidine synthase
MCLQYHACFLNPLLHPLLHLLHACYTVILQVIGTIDGSGRVRLVDKLAEPGTPTPVDLNLDQVGG